MSADLLLDAQMREEGIDFLFPHLCDLRKSGTILARFLAAPGKPERG